MKKILSALLAMTMIFSLAACSDKDDDSNRKKSSKTEKSDDNIIEEILDPTIEFKNTSIEEAVQNSLSSWSGSFKQSELNKITEIKIESCYSASYTLEELRYLKNLKKLSFERYSFTDLAPIGELTQLTELSFWNNIYTEGFTDISPLKNLTNLTSLSIENTSIADISPLSNLTNLTYLNLSHNSSIADFSSIGNLKNLTEIDFSHTKIADLSILVELEQLEYIYLSQAADWPCSYTKESALELTSLPNLKGLSLYYKLYHDEEIQNAFERIQLALGSNMIEK